ncbi:hypothetical protein QUF63_02250 [Anaerolineales bacterium HSG25]|nr:hypothetical protein [Anaerolineales bacterium HSG25]
MTPAQLATLPPELLTRLAEAADGDKMVMVKQTIQEIREYDTAIADGLTRVVRQ